MSPSPIFPIVFDRPLSRARLARALRGGNPDFLAERACEDLIERLLPVKRDFRAILDMASPRPYAAEALAARYPEAVVVRAAPLVGAIGQGAWLGLVADEEAGPSAPSALISPCRFSLSRASTICRVRLRKSAAA